MRGAVLQESNPSRNGRAEQGKAPLGAPNYGAGAGSPVSDSPDEVEYRTSQERRPGSEMVGRLISHYRIVDVIDAGGMGAVYKAEDTRLNNLVALKLLPRPLSSDAERRERFLREAQALSRISHANVCRFHEFSQTRDGQPFLVMEYCAGETLAARLTRGQLTIAEVIDISLQVACGLGAIHGHELVHRDINPRNLVIHPDGTVKIIDFGIARLLNDVGITSFGVRIGTPSYMSPEQMMGESGLNHRSDLWSFGVTLYEMLARQLPFASKQYDALAYEITAEDPRPIEDCRPDVPVALAGLIKRLLAKDPNARFQDTAAIEQELHSICAQGNDHTAVLPASNNAAQRVSRTWRSLGRSRWLSILAPLLLTAALGYQPASAWFAANGCLWFPDAAVPGCALPAMKHVALMDFQTSGDTEAARAFAAGLGEELKNQLEDLNHSDPAVCIGRPHHREHYGDNLWLEGVIRRRGDVVDVTASVRRPGESTLLRRLSTTVSIEDIYRIQQGLSHELAGLIGLDLESTQPAEVTNNVHSMELFLQGLSLLRQAHEAVGEDARKASRDAQTRLRQSLEIDRFHGPAYAALGDALRLDQSPSSHEAAIENYRRAIEQTALKGGAYLVSARTKLAETYLEAKQYPQAIEQFSEALRHDPSSGRTLRGLGQAYNAMGRYPEAEKAFVGAVNQQSGCWYNRWTLSKLYGRQGCDAKAVEQMETVVAADPANLYVQSALASYYLRMERYAQAEKALKYVVAREPRAVAISNLGWTYYLSQRFEESLEQMELAVSMEPGNSALNGNVGELALLLPGREEQARAAFRRAVELGERDLESNPGNAFSWAMNGYWRARLGDSGGALNAIARALEIAPANKEVQFRSATSYEMLGMRSEALGALERALKLGFSVNEVHRSEPLFNLLESEPYRKIEERIIALRQVRGGVDACELSAEARTAKLN